MGRGLAEVCSSLLRVFRTKPRQTRTNLERHSKPTRSGLEQIVQKKQPKEHDHPGKGKRSGHRTWSFHVPLTGRLVKNIFLAACCHPAIFSFSLPSYLHESATGRGGSAGAEVAAKECLCANSSKGITGAAVPIKKK